MERLPPNKKLVIGGGFKNGKLAIAIERENAELVTELNADHEEADTRLLLHAKYAASDEVRVVIQSPDTDVFVLCIAHSGDIGCHELWFRTGTKDHVRHIPVHTIAANLGDKLCKALPAFHALTGCDSTRSLSGVGKRKAWRVLQKSTEDQEILGRLGQCAI